MPSHGVENGRRIRGLVLLLRYSGMRIGDAVNFNGERLVGNRVFLYTQKTGVAVNTVLPEFVVFALAKTPRATNKFFFWSGRGELESIVRSWQTYLMGMRIVFATHSRLNCSSPACPSKEFQFCLATRVCELLKSITHRGYARDRSNWRLIWRAPRVGTHLYFLKVRYIRGTRKTKILQLIQFQQETMVPGVGVEPT